MNVPVKLMFLVGYTDENTLVAHAFKDTTVLEMRDLIYEPVRCAFIKNDTLYLEMCRRRTLTKLGFRELLGRLIDEGWGVWYQTIPLDENGNEQLSLVEGWDIVSSCREPGESK